MLKRVHLLVGAIVACLVMAVVISMVGEEREQHRRAQVFERLEIIRARLESVFNDRLHRVRGLAAFVKSRDSFTEEEFLKFASALEGDAKGIRSLQLAPGAVVMYMTNPERNAAARGHDLLNDPRRRAMVQRAIDRREFIIAGPLDLLQGGQALVGRMPVYRPDGEDGRDEFWGFSTILLDLQPLLAEAGILDQSTGLRFALRGRDGRGANGATFYGRPEAFAAGSVIVDVAIPNGSWQLAALVDDKWNAAPPGHLFYWIGGLVLSILAGWMMYVLLQRPEVLRIAVHRATAALQESEQRVRSITANIPGAVYQRRLDRDGRVSYPYVSEGLAELIGLQGPVEPSTESRADVLAENLEPASRGAWSDALRRSGDRGTPYDVELRYRLPTGEVRWMRSMALPHLSDDGARVWDGIALDITKQKRAEDQLRHSQKMEAVGQLTGGMAHDFNNLLAVIVGNLDLMRGELEEGSQLLPSVTSALQAAQRGANLTRAMLAFSRKQSLQPKLCNLNRLIREMSDMLGRTLGETTQVNTHLAPGLWQVSIDPNNFESVLLNLAINARHAMPDGGHLSIQTENLEVTDGGATAEPELVPGNYVVIRVSDDGIGMSDEVLNQAFDPFFTTKSAAEGSGLGLSVAYGFVRQSGGHISLSSAEGEGTTVRMYLPRKVSDGGVAANSNDDGQAVTGRGSNEVVLVVEDNLAVRHVVFQLLEELGYRVLEARDGPDAIAVMETVDRVDVLLTDIVMPGPMSGIELARHTRIRRPGIRVLHMSGYYDPAERVGDEDGPVLQKPFGKRELAQALRDVLDADVSPGKPGPGPLDGLVR